MISMRKLLAIALLALGILLNAIALYENINTLSRFRKAYSQEVSTAYREHRAIEPVSVGAKTIFVIAATIANISLVLSVLLLASYIILPLF